MNNMASVLSLIASQKQKKDAELWVIKLYHRLMKEYGYIPFDDYINMPYNTLKQLCICISDDYKRMEMAREKRQW